MCSTGLKSHLCLLCRTGQFPNPHLTVRCPWWFYSEWVRIRRTIKECWVIRALWFLNPEITDTLCFVFAYLEFKLWIQLVWVFVVYELERNNKAAIKITQHKKVYKRKKYFVFKIFATCHYFCHCKAQHRCQQYRNGQQEKTIKNKTLKEKQKQNPQSIFSLPSPSPKAL